MIKIMWELKSIDFVCSPDCGSGGRRFESGLPPSRDSRN
tara:strand:+ start:1689 stop:1805 length:117 start_codon:yes stop_codon:yes gene_type:complete